MAGAVMAYAHDAFTRPLNVFSGVGKVGGDDGANTARGIPIHACQETVDEYPGVRCV